MEIAITYPRIMDSRNIWADARKAMSARIVRHLAAAALLTASLVTAQEPAKVTSKASACLENRHHSEEQYVRLVDAEGKKHRYMAFLISEGTDQEWHDFERSRRMVALDDGLKLVVKVGMNEQGEVMLAPMGEIGRCKESKRAKYPKL